MADFSIKCYTCKQIYPIELFVKDTLYFSKRLGVLLAVNAKIQLTYLDVADRSCYTTI